MLGEDAPDLLRKSKVRNRQDFSVKDAHKVFCTCGSNHRKDAFDTRALMNFTQAVMASRGQNMRSEVGAHLDCSPSPGARTDKLTV